MHVQSVQNYCISRLNSQILDVLVAVFVVVAYTPYLHHGDHFAIEFYILLTNYAKKWQVGAVKNLI